MDNRLIDVLFQIAASPLSYGFYHTYPPYDHYEQRSQNDWPSPSTMPATSPPAMSVDAWNNNLKMDRIHITKAVDKNEKKNGVSWKPELPKAIKMKSEPRLYPIFTGPGETSVPVFTSVDAPIPIVDLTTNPGEVQADYALEMPFNGFRAQSPVTVVSS